MNDNDRFSCVIYSSVLRHPYTYIFNGDATRRPPGHWHSGSRSAKCMFSVYTKPRAAIRPCVYGNLIQRILPSPSLVASPSNWVPFGFGCPSLFIKMLRDHSLCVITIVGVQITQIIFWEALDKGSCSGVIEVDGVNKWDIELPVIALLLPLNATTRWLAGRSW